MSKPRIAVFACCLAVGYLSAVGRPIWAGQVPLPPAKTTAVSPNVLDLISYDAARNGPLLLLGRALLPHSEQGEIGSLSVLAETIRRRIVPLGTLTVLAPLTMRVIVDNPGKPNVYADMRAEQRFKMLLSLFSTAQWQLAGSTRGIGLDDMTEPQHTLFLSLLPEKMTFQHVGLAATDKPFEIHYNPQGDIQEADPALARLRLVRKVTFQFSKPDSDEIAAVGSVEPAPGDSITIFQGNAHPRGDNKPDSESVTVFGVPIIHTIPNRLKPGQLNFAASALQATVTLDGTIKTLGDLLARAASVTHLELMADKRIVDLPVFMRFAPRQGARAGDLLQALCWSVTGAFRHIGASAYLLTDDVPGIGTRWARLEEWAEEASLAHHLAMLALTTGLAKHDPLAHIGFAPDDPQSLPPALLQRIDDAARKSGSTLPPVFKPSDLPEALQQAFERNVQLWEANHITLRSDQVRVGTELSVQFVLPGNAAVEPFFARNIGRQYLRQIAAEPHSPPAAFSSLAAASPAPKPMPATLKKRVLLARLPDENGATVELLKTAQLKGFTEVWLQTRLDEATALIRLKAAIAAGKKTGVGVGLLVSLLHESGLGGTEDINIFEETSTQFSKRRTATAEEHMRSYYQRLGGWSVMDGEEAARWVTPLVRMPGLSALALKATAAPGWAGYSVGGDALPDNGHFGYGIVPRLAYLRAEGMDPLDVTHYSHILGEYPNLLFFPCASEELWQSLLTFRLGENKRVMAGLYTALRQAAPDLPLYLDDRVSSYADPNTRWYARWDRADRVPVNPVYAVESEARAAAFAHSSEPLLCQKWWNGRQDQMARIFGDRAQEAAKHWRGVTLDLTSMTPAETLRMLSGLPKSVPVGQ